MASLEAIQDLVANDAKKCWETFQEVIFLLNDDENRRMISLDFQEEFEGFRVWCRSAGAFVEDHASLDYRVRDNAPTRKLVRTILQGLASSLSQCTQILVPKAIAEEAEVSPSPRKASSSDSESSSDDTWQEPSLEDYLDDIVESINKLVKITKAIRQSSAYSGNSKAQAYEDVEQGPDGPVNKSQIFEQFIGEFLEKRYRETDSIIRARLQRAISRCNRHFAYRRRHQQKLFYGSVGIMEARSNVLPQPKQAIAPPLIQPIDGDVPANVHSNGSETRTYAPSSHMTASTLRPDFRPFDTKSSVISGSSFSRMSRNPSDDLPPAPPLEAGNRYFQCPYCCVLLPRNKSDPRAWRKHVISDLRPFVCVFSECSLAEPFFETKDDWLQHEQGQHNLEWYCDGLGTHSPITFTSHDSFKAHFTACHSGIFDSEEIEKLIGMSSRPSATAFENCPFCDFQVASQETCDDSQCSPQESKSSQCRLENHILDHMLALFMIALPERNDLPDLVSSDSNSRADVQSIQDPKTVDPDSEYPDYIDFEYSSSPLLDDDQVPETTGDIWDSAIRGRLINLWMRFHRLINDLSELIDDEAHTEGKLSELKHELETLKPLLELWDQIVAPESSSELHSPPQLQPRNHSHTIPTSNTKHDIYELLHQWYPTIAGISVTTLEESHDESEYMVLGQLSDIFTTVGNLLTHDLLDLSDNEFSQTTDRITNKVRKILSIVYSLLLRKSQRSDGENGQIPLEKNRTAKETFIRRLSSLDFLARQKEIFDGCLDTSQWLIESEEFRAWSSGRPWTLHIEGLPGVGKTALSSLVINHLNERFRHNDKIAVLCLYLDYKESDYQTAENLIASLLKQLIQQQSSPILSSNVQEAESGHLSDREIHQTLSVEIKTLERVYLVVDALDEYKKAGLLTELKMLSDKLSIMTTTRLSEGKPTVSCNGCGRESLNVYFRCTTCASFHVCQGCVSTQITCGNAYHHMEEPYSSVRLDIPTHGSGTMRYIKNYLEVEKHSSRTENMGTRKLDRFFKQNPQLRLSISHTISEAANGNYLYAKLLLCYLETKKSIGEVKNAMSSLPRALEMVYEDLFNSLDSQPQSNSEVSKCALSWIVHAYRPLNAVELQHAIVLSPGVYFHQSVALTKEENLVGFAAGLVTGLDKGASARLIHYTAQEHFDQNRPKCFPNAVADIAFLIINSLCSDVLSATYSNTRERRYTRNNPKIQEAFENFPLLSYASEFWGYHAREAQADIGVQAAILQLVCSPIRLESTMLAARYTRLKYRSNNISVTDTNGLRVCSWFGIDTVIPDLMKKGFDIDEQEQEGYTALMYACRNGHIRTVATLLDYDSHVNIFSHRGNTALFEAINWRKNEVVELLLTRGKDTDVNGRGGSESRTFTVLTFAVLYASEEILRALVKRKDIQMNLRDGSSRTALLMAVGHGKTSLASIILRHPDTRTDLYDENGDSALMIASKKGHTEIIKLLLFDRGVDPSMNKALVLAVKHDRVDAVKILLDQNANHHTPDDEGRSLLSIAVRNGKAEMLCLLLDRGMDANSLDMHGKTPLHEVCEVGLLNEREMIRILLERGADPLIEDGDGKRPPIATILETDKS